MLTKVHVIATALLPCFLGISAFAQLSTQNPAPRPSDPRLAQKINASQKEDQQGESLREYFQQVSKDSDVGHEVVQPFDLEPTVVLNANLRLGRLHRAIATTYQLSWKASEGTAPTYSLRLRRSDQQIRANARERAAIHARQNMNARLAQVRRLAFLSKDQLQQAADSGDKQARSFLHPRTGAMAKLVFQLPTEMWRQLEQGKAPIVPIASLPADLQGLAKQAAGTTRVTTSTGEDYQVADLVVPQGRIRLQMGGTLDRPTIWGSLRYGPNGNDFNVLYFEGGVRQPPEDRRKQALAGRSKPPNDSEFKRKVTLRDVPRKRFYEPGERPKSARPLLEYLRQLSVQTDLPIVADCEYKSKEKDRDGTWLDQQWWLASDIVNRPLSEALDLLCADFEYEWQFRDGVLIIRPKRWFQDRADRAYVYATKRFPEGPR